MTSTKKLPAKRRRRTIWVTDEIALYFEHLERQLLAEGRKPGTRPPYGEMVSAAISRTKGFREWKGEQK